MEASDWLWVWIGAAVAFGFLELITPFLFFMISFAAGAVLAAASAALGASVALQLVVFVIASIAALLVLVPIGRRLAVAETDEAHEGATRQVGRVAVVLDDIPPGTHDTGLVRLERQQWRAETDSDMPIPAGSQVEVISIRGTRLVVAPVRPAAPVETERASAGRGRVAPPPGPGVDGARGVDHEGGVSPPAASDAVEKE
jgi:membrane protein implicated in regulation of membrane protease activity